jgi:hypothetical protein
MDRFDKKFPLNRAFLEQMQAIADEASKFADAEALKLGKSVPAGLDAIGTMLVFVYGLATCGWGCKGGDHQIEWLLGRVVNQTTSAHRLMRSGFYDEALVLIRGIGEIANLLWLFGKEPSAMDEWKTCDRRTRMNKYGPAGVRRLLKTIDADAPLIDEDRYRALCEVGAHPIPAFKPGHYSGGGPPILGMIFQAPGYAMCVNELGFALAMCATPAARLLKIDPELKQVVVDMAVELLRKLGSMTVLNYEEYIAKARAAEKPPEPDEQASAGCAEEG